MWVANVRKPTGVGGANESPATAPAMSPPAVPSPRRRSTRSGGWMACCSSPKKPAAAAPLPIAPTNENHADAAEWDGAVSGEMADKAWTQLQASTREKPAGEIEPEQAVLLVPPEGSKEASRALTDAEQHAAATRRKAKAALVGGLRSGKLAAAVAEALDLEAASLEATRNGATPVKGESLLPALAAPLSTEKFVADTEVFLAEAESFLAARSIEGGADAGGAPSPSPSGGEGGEVHSARGRRVPPKKSVRYCAVGESHAEVRMGVPTL